MRSLFSDEWLKTKLTLIPLNEEYQAVLYIGLPIGFIAKPFGMTWRSHPLINGGVGHLEPMEAAIDVFRAVFEIDENGVSGRSVPELSKQ